LQLEQGCTNSGRMVRISAKWRNLRLHYMSMELRKIRFYINPAEWHGRPSETLWAEPVEETASSATFRLRNSPFFAEGVSFLDMVRAKPDRDGDGLEFAGVIKRSGHSSYLILVPADSVDFAENWKVLEDLGCSYESKTLVTRGGNKILYAVDVPPEADIYAVYESLSDGERKGMWTFQEGHVGHKLKGEPNTRKPL
jgi:hypothetical protein